MNTFLSNHWLKLVAIALLLGALGNFPFVYYQIMNWVVVGASLVTVQQAYQQNMTPLGWLFAVVAVIFNPLAPLYLRADVWQIADLTTAALFIISFFFITSKKQPQVRTT
jgi:FtsH-binding integral membrane protein